MGWNYRIVRYRENNGFGLHEVYYDKDGQAWGMTEDAARFVCDVDEGPEGVKDSLMLAHTDARKHPVFDEPETWPGEAP